MTRRAILAVLLGILMVSRAAAQDAMIYLDAAHSIAGTIAMNAAIDAHARQAAGRPGGGTAPRESRASLAFTPSPEAESRAAGNLASLLSQADPQGGAEIRRTLLGGELQRNYPVLMRDQGLDPHDLGDVISAFYLVMWQVAHDRVASPAEVQGARDQLGPLVAAQDAVRSAPAKEKQDIAANLSLLTMVALVSHHGAKESGDQATLDTLRRSIFEAMDAQGVDLRAVALTSEGFARKD